jgi:hypothetical protein
MGCSGYNMVVDLVQAYSLMPKSGLDSKQQYPAGRRGCVTGLCSVGQKGKRVCCGNGGRGMRHGVVLIHPLF